MCTVKQENNNKGLSVIKHITSIAGNIFHTVIKWNSYIQWQTWVCQREKATYYICDQEMLRQDCTVTQSRMNLRGTLIQYRNIRKATPLILFQRLSMRIYRISNSVTLMALLSCLGLNMVHIWCMICLLKSKMHNLVQLKMAKRASKCKPKFLLSKSQNVKELSSAWYH